MELGRCMEQAGFLKAVRTDFCALIYLARIKFVWKSCGRISICFEYSFQVSLFSRTQGPMTFIHIDMCCFCSKLHGFSEAFFQFDQVGRSAGNGFTEVSVQDAAREIFRVADELKWIDCSLEGNE